MHIKRRMLRLYSLFSLLRELARRRVKAGVKFQAYYVNVTRLDHKIEERKLRGESVYGM